MAIRRRAFALLLASAVTAVLSIVSAQAAHAAAPSGPFSIRNVGIHNQCVQPNPSNTGPDIQLVEETCDGSALQQWRFWSLGGSDYHIQNVATLNCMRALANQDFSPVDTIDCTNISNEQWTVANLTNTSLLHQVISRVGGGSRCLDVFDDRDQPDTSIDIFHCTTNNAAQTFVIQ